MNRVIGLTCLICFWFASISIADIAPPTRKHLAFIGIEKYPEYEFYIYFKYSKPLDTEGKREFREYERLKKIVDANPIFDNDFHGTEGFEVIAIPKKTLQRALITLDSRPNVQGMLVAIADAKSKYPVFSGASSDGERNENFRYRVIIENGELLLSKSDGIINSQNVTQWVVGIIIPIAILALLVWILRRNRTVKPLQSPPNPT